MAKKDSRPSGKKPQKQPQIKPTPASSQPPVRESSQRSALKTARITSKKPAQPNEDDKEIQPPPGVFDDRDEHNDFEGDHARNSPTKNGRRADNKVSRSLIH